MPEKLRRPRKHSSAPRITVFIILIIGLLYLGWSFISGEFPWQQPQVGDEPKITWLEKKSPEDQTAAPTAENMPESAEPAPPLHLKLDEAEPAPGPENDCRETADKIFIFFEHLGTQEYIRDYAFKGTTLDHFRGIINKLIANPPVVVRETDDLFAILNNMAHFFRVLGPRDIQLLKDVLIHEREIIEPTMAVFYRWSEIAPECPDVNLDIDLPLAGLYEYAGYFINTLGGQSYLFRRELYLRVLIRYYSVLIIDRANRVDANRYGIDIRYTLDSLISEIQGNRNLMNRQEYLEVLLRLQDEYQAKYGGN